MKYLITDVDGKEYSVYTAGKLLGRHKSTIQNWYLEGHTTIESLTARHKNKKTKHTDGQKRYETNRGMFTCREVATIAKNSTESVYGRAKRYGWDSVAVWWGKMSRTELTVKLKEAGLYVPTRVYTKGKEFFKYLPDVETGERLRYKDVATIIGVSSDAITSYTCDYGCKTLQDCIARRAYLDKYPRGKNSIGAPEFLPPSSLKSVADKPFDRTVICMRKDSSGGVTDKCKHYVKCSDSRAFTRIHIEGVYKVDGSCYDGERLEPSKILGDGQLTDVVQHHVNRY